MNFAVFGLQNVPPAPGREAQPGAPVEPRPASGAPSGAPDPGITGMLFPLLLVGMLLFIFWSSRSQQKKQDQAIAALKKGDRVVTQSGLVGRLGEIEGKYVKLEIAPGVKVQVLRTSLAGRDADDAPQKKEKGEAASP